MDAVGVCVDGQWDEAESAVACVADISIDGGPAVPMMGLLERDGDLVIPTDWDDPPVADGVGHVIRIELRSPRIRVGPGRALAMLEGCHAWRLGYGAVASEPKDRNGGRAHVLVASTLPGSLRSNTPATEEPDAPDRFGARGDSGWLCTVALLAGFVVGWLIMRGFRPSPDNHAPHR